MKKVLIVGCLFFILLTSCTIPQNNSGYKVTFNDSFNDEKKIVTFEAGDIVSPIVKNDIIGWVFVGWYQDSSFNQEYEFNTPLTSNLELYAKYEKATYLNSSLSEIDSVTTLEHLAFLVHVNYIGNDYIICENIKSLKVNVDVSLIKQIDSSFIEIHAACENGEILEVVEIINNADITSEFIVSKNLTSNDLINNKYSLCNYEGIVTSVDTNNKMIVLDNQIRVSCENLINEVIINEKCTLQKVLVFLDDEIDLLFLDYSIFLQDILSDSDNYEIVKPLETLDDLINKEEYYLSKGLPSIGNPKVLVMPIAFSDYPAPIDMKANLEIAFFGTSEETGWESLNSYYYKSSYGKLNIEGTVLEPFNVGKTSIYYEEKYNNGNQEIDYEIIQAALTYYDSQIDYNEYDTNGDGYIDSLYFVYTAPVSYGETIDECDMWWAYTYEYFTEDYEYYDGVEADYYVFMGYDFLFEELCYGTNPTYVELNAATIIHETGHLLGLDDYYDYDPSLGPKGGLGGADMMDSNVGDHNAYSKIILGWIEPKIVTGCGVIELNSFSTGADVLIIKKENNQNFFSEYLMIEFYNKDGLNEIFADGYNLYSSIGLKIYHVDATLKSNPDSIMDITKFNNTDTRHKLIAILEADDNNNITNGDGYFENDDLFQTGDNVVDYKWHDNSIVEYDIYVLLIENNKIQIEIK